ncbi:MAG: type ISP restriction/modification enzyme [Candidatus Brocadiia bacterium]
MTTVFPLNGAGMTTARDSVVIDIDRAKLLNRIRQFKHSRLPDGQLHEVFQIRRKKGWDIRRAWEMLQDMTDSEVGKHTVRVLYRPFDVRWIFYHDSLVWRTAKRVMRHMLRTNVALLWTRPMSPKYEFSCLCTYTVVDQCVVGNKSAGAGISYCGPLRVYPDTSKDNLFSELEESAERRPNLHPDLIPALTDTYGFEPTPEDVFHYVYAVLYAPSYREKYAEFLKIDFPRVPFSADPELFRALAARGERLVALHLLESDDLNPPDAKFQGDGDDVVARTKAKGFRYEPDDERVYINPTQYFEPVPQEVWEYQVGGYQVCHKWLKDRRERPLTLEETKTYARIVRALARTIEVQEEIDALYPEAEREIVELGL